MTAVILESLQTPQTKTDPKTATRSVFVKGLVWEMHHSSPAAPAAADAR